VLTSATLPNAAELAERLTGRPARVIDRDGAPAGRRGEDALAILVGLDTAINQYLMRRPGYLFDRPIEAASVEPDNPYVVLIVEPGPRGERTIGEVDRYDAQPIVHPHAIYLHRGETYEVERLDLDRNKAIVRKVDVDYYTEPIGGTDVDHIDAPLRERPLGPACAFFGEVTAYSRTYAYETVRFYELDARSRHHLDLPVEWFDTHALWIEAPVALMRSEGQVSR